MTTISPISLLDVEADRAIEAELRDAIEEAQLVDWEGLWIPALMDALRRLHAAGVPRQQWPQSRHWDWRGKLEVLQSFIAHRSFCIVCDGMTQGLMAVDLTRVAQLQSQLRKPLVYVEYLENAPWNRPELFKPRYRGVGSVLMRAAIELSYEEEFRGRVGLHSLPQANRFYRDTCGMTDLGPDPGYQNLHYFEMTEEEAQNFVQRGE